MRDRVLTQSVDNDVEKRNLTTFPPLPPPGRQVARGQQGRAATLITRNKRGGKVDDGGACVCVGDP